MIASWQEQRDWGLTYALEALQLGGSPLAGPVAAAWADVYPDPNPPPPAQDGWAPASPGQAYAVGRWTLGFDTESGAVAELSDAVTGQTWAAAGDASFLGRLQYDTYDNASIAEYLRVGGHWQDRAGGSMRESGLWWRASQPLSCSRLLAGVRVAVAADGQLPQGV